MKIQRFPANKILLSIILSLYSCFGTGVEGVLKLPTQPLPIPSVTEETEGKQKPSSQDQSPCESTAQETIFSTDEELNQKKAIETHEKSNDPFADELRKAGFIFLDENPDDTSIDKDDTINQASSNLTNSLLKDLQQIFQKPVSTLVKVINAFKKENEKQKNEILSLQEENLTLASTIAELEKKTGDLEWQLQSYQKHNDKLRKKRYELQSMLLDNAQQQEELHTALLNEIKKNKILQKVIRNRISELETKGHLSKQDCLKLLKLIGGNYSNNFDIFQELIQDLERENQEKQTQIDTYEALGVDVILREMLPYPQGDESGSEPGSDEESVLDNFHEEGKLKVVEIIESARTITAFIPSRDRRHSDPLPSSSSNPLVYTREVGLKDFKEIIFNCTQQHFASEDEIKAALKKHFPETSSHRSIFEEFVNKVLFAAGT